MRIIESGIDFNWFKDLAILAFRFDHDSKIKLFNTAEEGPIMDFIFVYLNSEFEQNIVNAEGFIDINSYPTEEYVRPNEIGIIGNCRIILDDKIKGFKVDINPLIKEN